MAKWKIWKWKQQGRDETVEELEEIVKEAKDRHTWFVIFYAIAVVIVCLGLRIAAVTSESILSNGLRYFFAGLPFVFLFLQRGIVKQRLDNFTGTERKDLVDLKGLVPNVANESDVDILSVEIREPDLEAVFLHLTGRALRD